MLTRLRQPANNLLATNFSPSTRCLAPRRLPHPLSRPLLNLTRPPTRPFTSSPFHNDNTPPDHYQVLNVPRDCTKSELKKQFYHLSKQSHPDTNPNDPTASTRFAQISESYSVLADPDRRARYDRDYARYQQQSGPKQRGGSYAGSRPASGLSKRRGTFRGPPPSFYAQKNAGTSSTGSASSSSTSGYAQQGSPFNGEYADFDPAPIHRTQTHEDTRRQTRREAAMAAAQAESEDEGDFWVRFAVVTGIILLGISVASLVGGAGAPKGGLVRGDGSRRANANGNGSGNAKI